MKTRKQIIFDIDTKVAEKILGANYRSIYYKIRNFLSQYGYIHIEGSSYLSKNKIDYVKVLKMTKALKKQFPYLEKCIRDMRVADVVDDYNSLNYFFDYDGTPGKYAQNENDIQNENDEYYDDFEM